MDTKLIPARLEYLEEGLDFIQDTLNRYRLKHRWVQAAVLLSEESIVSLLESAEPDSQLQIAIRKSWGLATVTLSAPGTTLKSAKTDLGMDLSNSDLSRDNESAVRDILMKSYENRLQYARKGEYNFIKVTAGMPEQVFALRTIMAFLLAVVMAVLGRFLLPQSAKEMLDVYLLSPVEEIFLNSLRLATAPAVFFSIVTGVARSASFSDPGRVSVKVLCGYLITSVVAVFVGFGIFNLLQPGTPGMLKQLVEVQEIDRVSAEGSIIRQLVNIVPSNIVAPFLNMDTLQLTFIALLCGVALGRIGDYSQSLRTAMDALNTLFGKVAEMLSRLMPVATFVATLSIAFNIGYVALVELLKMLGTLLLAAVSMLCFYLLLVLVIGRVNPLVFLKKYAPTMWNTLLLGSGLQAMPKTVRCCKTQLGISPKVYSFSIPFGAMANMDGNCIYLSIAGLFLARLCGVEIFGTEVLYMVFTIVVMSVGAQLAAGTTLLCLTVLLSQMGVSVTAICLLMGVNGIIEMCLAMNNTLGDVAVSLAVARSEKLLDLDIYYAKAKAKQKRAGAKK